MKKGFGLHSRTYRGLRGDLAFHEGRGSWETDRAGVVALEELRRKHGREVHGSMMVSSNYLSTEGTYLRSKRN